MWLAYNPYSEHWWIMQHEGDYNDHCRLFKVTLGEDGKPSIKEVPNESAD